MSDSELDDFAEKMSLVTPKRETRKTEEVKFLTADIGTREKENGRQKVKIF